MGFPAKSKGWGSLYRKIRSLFSRTSIKVYSRSRYSSKRNDQWDCGYYDYSSLGLTVSEIGYRIAKAKMNDENLDIEKFMETYVTPEVVNSLFEQFFKKELKNKGE